MKYGRAKTNAERCRDYRQRRRDDGKKAIRGLSTKNKSKWEASQFIAVDGEGESYGEEESITIGKDGKTYVSKPHRYTLLACSTGESLYSNGERLSTMDCINFLLDTSDNHEKAIFVIFGGSYDVNHMLMYGFEREQLQNISRGERVEFKHNEIIYDIEYRARKSLNLRRGKSWIQNKEGKWTAKWESKIIIWDVWGFFQDNFVTVIDKWLTKKYKHYDLIKDMKARRGDFANVESWRIQQYNAAELEALCDVMNKVREAIDGLDLHCQRWDGAGAVAASIMKKHNIREFKMSTDEQVINAVRCAYAGGRIEVCKIGRHEGPVYDYDINSAYPSVNQQMPCMLHGRWLYGETDNPPEGFTMVHVKFDFADDMPFYPLFYRTDKMQISFPGQGEGIYWYPEYQAALACAGTVEVMEWWHWQQDCNHQPFHWIGHYYETRQKWVKNPIEEWHKGGEKIIKLGLNSLYGKTAQQLGGTIDKPPVYHQLEWAGYITAATRARLYRAAITDRDSVIGFATDGIFTTRPLGIETSKTKEIGAWELKEPVPVGITIAMAGVYWWHYEDGNFQHYSRGFDKDSMRTPENILSAWARGMESIDIPMRRLIGMGSACTSNDLWKIRGRFTEGRRTLRLDGHSHKREGINVKKSKPHKGLVDLRPSYNMAYDDGNGYQGSSHPYPVLWLDGELTDDYEKEQELIKEMLDTDNI